MSGEGAEQVNTPLSRKRDRDTLSPSTTSPTLFPPAKKPATKMATPSFADDLLAALDDDRISKRLGDIISESLRRKIEQQAAKIDTLEAKVSALEKNLRVQDTLLDDQEQYSRRDNVMIWLPEKETREDDTDTIVMAVAAKMNVPMKLEEISRSHRVGKPSPDKPRAIICRFLNWRVKHRFMKARATLKTTKIYVSEDLTRVKSHLFFLTRQKQKEKKCAQCWTFDGKIFLKLTIESQPMIVFDPAHLERVCA